MLSTVLVYTNYYYRERGNQAIGINFILCQLSERFWIIATREEIHKGDSEYKRKENKPACQIIVPLPKTRPCFTSWPSARKQLASKSVETTTFHPHE